MAIEAESITDIMNGRLKMLVVAGARPNFMKVAPLLKAAVAHNADPRNAQKAIDCLLVHTGQHYDEKMSDVFFRELGIPAPDVNLDVGSGSHAVQTANVMLKFEPVCKETRPDWVVVVGDVNSTVACTLVAAKLGIRVAHVEAGLRSFDRAMPEEINRLVTDALADLLLTPSSDADLNLLNEGIPKSRIRLVGNIMIDSLIANLEKARQSKILKTLELTPGKFAFVTLHRPSNVDSQSSLTALMRQLRSLSTRLPIVFPMHPRTRKMLETFQIDSRSDRAFQIIEPVGYHDSLCLAENARIVLTDSGGLQEETTYFQTPCLTLRPNTERPVTVTIGSNRLTGLEHLEQDLSKALGGGARVGQIPPMWDGATAARCLKSILDVSQAARDAKTV
jgi:UDP-N-acetylglucosamine 2-epimerase (non-hydrolysing)